MSCFPIVGSKWDDMVTVLLDKNQSVFRNFQFRDDLSHLELIYNSKIIREVLHKWINTLGRSTNKTTIVTNEYRSKGNELYKDVYKRGAEAIECYTKAIFTAPKNSKELGLSHANRAAALIALDYYKEAYNDCEMAIEHSYPRENLIKVLLRQATSSVFLKNKDNLRKNIIEIEKHIVDNKLTTFAGKVREFKVELEKLENDQVSNVTDNVHSFKEKSIKIKSSYLYGRYVTAAESIDENDVIVNETAFAFVPVYRPSNDMHYVDYNCQNCARTNVIPFPCYECFRASYCSPACRIEHHSIHRYECEGYKRDLWFEIGIAQLSIRTVLTGLEEVLPKLSCPKEPHFRYDILKVLTTHAKLDESFRYGQIIRLVHNFDKMEREDLLRYSLTAVMLTVYLKNCTSYFDDISNKAIEHDSVIDWEKFVALLMTLHMGQLVCNGHAISDLLLTQPIKLNCLNSKDTVRLGMLHCYISNERIFTAIFPQISILNHSCDPNIRNRFENNSLTTYATRNIPANGEIFNCYGPNYKLMHRDDRRTALQQQYCFDCTCSKCVEYDDSVTKFQTYICQKKNCRSEIIVKYPNCWWRNNEGANFGLSCRKCGQKQNLDWHFLFINSINHMQIKEVFNDECNQACDVFQNASKFMCDYHEHKMDMANILLSNSVLLAGNDIHHNLSTKLLKIAKDYLKGCESRFGKFSLEFVVASAFLLDLLAIRKRISKDSQPEYDLDDIITSVDILSSSSKVLFMNYINNYIL